MPPTPGSMQLVNAACLNSHILKPPVLLPRVTGAVPGNVGVFTMYERELDLSLRPTLHVKVSLVGTTHFFDDPRCYLVNWGPGVYFDAAEHPIRTFSATIWARWVDKSPGFV